MKRASPKWSVLLATLVAFSFSALKAAAQCSTPTGVTFTESFGDSANACWPGGPLGCDQAWQVQGGTYSIVASPDGAPADTACANSLSMAASATPARLQTYGTIPDIPAGTTLDLFFTLYVTSAPRSNSNFIQLRNVTRTTNAVLAQIVWTNSNGTFLYASGSSSSANTAAVALNSWHSVQLHIDATSASSIALDGGTPQTFTANAQDMNALVIYGDTIGSYDIGNMYINAPGYAPTGSPMLVDFAGGIPGTPITTATLNAASHCVNVPWTMSTSNMTDMVFSTEQTHNLHTSVQACGNTYAGDSGMSLRYDMSSSQVATYWYETLSPSASLGFFYYTTVLPNSETFYCNADIMGALDYACVHQHGNGKTLQIWLEVNIAPELYGAPIPISPNSWYWITLQYNAGGTHHLRVYETQNWTLIGASDGPSNHGVDMPLRYTFGRSGSSPGPPGTYLYFSNMELDWVAGKFPLGPGGGDIPAAPAITSADHTTFIAGSAGSFTVTTTGSPTPTLSMAGTPPAGVNFDASTGILSGTPAAGVAGTYPLQFTASNSLDSTTQSFTLNVSLGQTAKPAFTPGGGTYAAAQTVSISDTTPGSTIYYTTDGTPASGSSTLYGPSNGSTISIPSTTTLNAIAVTPGYADSAVATATYTITPPAPPAPTFDPAAGTYTTTQTVMLSNSSGAPMFYTTDGSAPTTASVQYLNPIPVNRSTTIRAITFSGGVSSATVSSAYTLRVPTPLISPGAGTYTSPPPVTITDSNPNGSIFYTTNGSTPTTASTPYSGPITLTRTTTVRAISALSGWSNSNAASANYTLRVPTPTFSPAAGTYTGTQSITISDVLAGARIYYTLNGSTPTTSSTRYTGPISVSRSRTIRAIAAATGWSTSSTAAASYTIH